MKQLQRLPHVVSPADKLFLQNLLAAVRAKREQAITSPVIIRKKREEQNQ